MALSAGDKHAQVLNLCIWSVTDVEVLVRLNLVSKAVQGYCKSHVQKHLPMLLVSAFEDWKLNREWYDPISGSSCRVYPTSTKRDKAVKWLCQSAGPAAVGSPAAALALLPMVGPDSYSSYLDTDRELRQMAVVLGMQLTTEVLVAAAKETIDVHDWLKDYAKFPEWRAQGQLPPIAELPPHVLAAGLGKMALLAASGLPASLNAEQMSDLLHIAVNCHGSMFTRNDATDVVHALLKHDSQHTHVLHSNSSSKDSGSTNSADNSYSSTQLVEKLLTTSVLRQHQKVVQLLGDTPAAQALSAGAVLKLLYLAMQLEPSDLANKCHPDSSHYNSKSTLAAVCQLPAVQIASTASICCLVQITWKRTQYGSVGRLFTLPQAQELPSQLLCDMLVPVIQAWLTAQENRDDKSANHWQTLLNQLTTLQCGQHLAPGDAYKVMKAVLQMHQPRKLQRYLMGTLEDIAPLLLGSQLTGNEMLNLLRFAVENSYDSHVYRMMVSLAPAADQIDDEEEYTNFLQSIIIMGSARRSGPHWYCPYRLNTIADKIPFTQNLGVNSVAQLLHTTVTDGLVHSFLWRIPALLQLSAATVEQALLQAAKKGFMHELQPLQAVPSVAQLTTEFLHQLIHVVIAHARSKKHTDDEKWQEAKDFPTLSQFLALDAAKQLTTDSLVCIMLFAVELHAYILQSGVEGRHVSGPEESSVGANRITSFIDSLLLLPGSKQVTLGSAVELLQAAIAAGSTKQVSLFSGLPAASEMDDSTAKQLWELALEQGNVKVLQMLQDCLPRVASTVSFVQLTEEHLKKQIASAIAQQNERALAELCQHPKAAGISSVGIAGLLQGMCLGVAKGHWLCDSSSVQLLFGTQELGPSAIAGLLRFCTSCSERPVFTAISLLAKLPGAANVEVECCEVVLSDILHWFHHDAANLDRASYADFNVVWVNTLHAVESLLQLPALQALPAEKVAQHLEFVMKNDTYWRDELLDKMINSLPGVHRLSVEQVKAMMQIAMESQATSTFTWLSRLQSAPTDDDVQAWRAVMQTIS